MTNKLLAKKETLNKMLLFRKLENGPFFFFNAIRKTRNSNPVDTALNNIFNTFVEHLCILQYAKKRP